MPSDEIRINGFKDRLSSLYDHIAAHDEINNDVPNRNLWFRLNVLEEADHDKAEINMAALESADNEIKSLYDQNEYKSLRKTDYPSIEDQLDQIYNEGLESWKNTIRQTKEKYPKT